MIVLGLSAFYHDSAAALVVDGKIVAAAQEERFTRKKHDARFPHCAIYYCLSQFRIRLDQVDYIVFYDKPFLKFERLLETYLAFVPHGFQSFRKALPVWIKEKIFQKENIIRELKKTGPCLDFEKKVLFTEHHQAHAASAFYPSSYNNAVILTMDGVGEWATTSAALGKGNDIQMVREIHFPHSLGLLYSAFTYYTGFKVNSGEYKVMGLAPYGTPKYRDLILENLIDLKEDGSFRLDMSYFNYCTGLTMTAKKFHRLFGGPPRKREDRLTQRHMDLAASIQWVTEEVVLRIAKDLAKSHSSRNLCMAGGVALNCVANGKLLRSNYFENIWIQPAAGDAGGAVGAALTAYYKFLGNPRSEQSDGKDHMQGGYLGPEYSDDEICRQMERLGAKYVRLQPDQFIRSVGDELASGKAIGWFQGRMEFGPRALGARSILADPRSESMQKNLNLKVKFRESFRPFAPAILSEDAKQWFDIGVDSPYMLLVADVLQKHRREITQEERNLFGIDKLNVQRSTIPAVTHVDYSARIQTVHRETNPKLHTLLSYFKNKTNCPVIVNTSFNVRGEPIVCNPEDAFRCFMGTDLDILAIGNCILKKEAQDTRLEKRYERQFELD